MPITYVDAAGVDFATQTEAFAAANNGFIRNDDGGQITIRKAVTVSTSQVDQDTKIATKAAIDLATANADDAAFQAANTEDAIGIVGGVVKLYDAATDTVRALADDYQDVDQFYESLQAIRDARTAATDKTPFESATGRFGVLADDGSYKIYRWNGTDFAEIADTTATAQYAITVDTAAAASATVVLAPGVSLPAGQTLVVEVNAGTGFDNQTPTVAPAGPVVRLAEAALGQRNRFLITGISADSTVFLASTIAAPIAPLALDAAADWVATTAYTGTNNKIFAAVSTGDPDINGATTTAGTRYLWKYPTDQTSGAALDAAEFAKMELVGDPSNVPTDKKIELAADLALTIATDLADENQLYMLVNTDAAPHDVTSDATAQRVNDVATTPYSIPADSSALIVRTGTEIDIYPVKQSVDGLQAWFVDGHAEENTKAQWSVADWKALVKTLGDEIDLTGQANATLTDRKLHVIDNVTTLDLPNTTAGSRAFTWNSDTNEFAFYRSDGTNYVKEGGGVDTNSLIKPLVVGDDDLTSVDDIRRITVPNGFSGATPGEQWLVRPSDTATFPLVITDIAADQAALTVATAAGGDYTLISKLPDAVGGVQEVGATDNPALIPALISRTIPKYYKVNSTTDRPLTISGYSSIQDITTGDRVAVTSPYTLVAGGLYVAYEVTDSEMTIQRLNSSFDPAGISARVFKMRMNGVAGVQDQATFTTGPAGDYRLVLSDGDISGQFLVNIGTTAGANDVYDAANNTDRLNDGSNENRSIEALLENLAANTTYHVSALSGGGSTKAIANVAIYYDERAYVIDANDVEIDIAGANDGDIFQWDAANNRLSPIPSSSTGLTRTYREESGVHIYEYSDGHIKQWGTTTGNVTFAVEMADTNYDRQVTVNTGAYREAHINSVSTTGMILVRNGGTAASVSWSVEGQRKP